MLTSVHEVRYNIYMKLGKHEFKQFKKAFQMKITLKFWQNKKDNKDIRIYLNTVVVRQFSEKNNFNVEHKLDFGYISYSNKEYDYSNIKLQAIDNNYGNNPIILNLNLNNLKSALLNKSLKHKCKIYELAMVNSEIELLNNDAVELINKLEQYNEDFKNNPTNMLGYDTFTDFIEHANDYIVQDFMRDKFNILSENEVINWQNIEKAQDFYESVACDLRNNAQSEFADWAKENGNTWDEFVKKYIKDIEYNDDLVGFVLILKNDKIVQVQYALETNRLHADYNTHYAHIDKENNYCLDLTNFEEFVVNEFIRYDDEIQQKGLELDQKFNLS